MELITILLVGVGLNVVWQFVRLTDDCYDHVKELIRSDQHAGHRSMRRQEQTAMLTRRRLFRPGGLYQPTAITPAGPWRYVWLRPRWPFFLVVPTRRNVRGATIHWTPLVTYPSTEWQEELANCVAHFLGVAPHEVELASVNTYRKWARIFRT